MSSSLLGSLPVVGTRHLDHIETPTVRVSFGLVVWALVPMIPVGNALPHMVDGPGSVESDFDLIGQSVH